MNKLIKAAIVFSLIIVTQVASSQGSGQYDQDEQFNSEIYPVRPNPPEPRDPRDPRDPRRPREQLVWVSAGEVRTRKVVDNEFTFRPRLNERVYRMRLVGTGSGVIIRNVIVEFRNGDRLDARQLEGRLREGQRAALNINGRFVRKVTVTATTESLVGARGKFRLDLGVYRY